VHGIPLHVACAFEIPVLELHSRIQVNFILLEIRVNGGTSISWKLLNTFRL